MQYTANKNQADFYKTKNQTLSIISSNIVNKFF